MTQTLSSRRFATNTIVLVAPLLLAVAYLLGTSHNNGASAAPAVPPSVAPGASTGITVSGVGRVSGTPDDLRLDVGVSTRGRTVSDALRSANSAAAAVQKSLRDNGVAARDLKTTGVSIQPDYSTTKDGNRPDGFLAVENLTASLRDLDRAGDVISNAVAAGGDAVRVNSVSLDLDDSGALISSARTRAFDDAKAKAEQYANAAGRLLGPVVSIDESVAGSSPRVFDGAYVAQSAASAVPIQTGSQDVAVTVSVVFSLR